MIDGWYCPTCVMDGIHGQSVTHDECHTRCGEPVEWISEFVANWLTSFEEDEVTLEERNQILVDAIVEGCEYDVGDVNNEPYLECFGTGEIQTTISMSLDNRMWEVLKAALDEKFPNQKESDS